MTTRRSFLHSAAASAAALTLPTFRPESIRRAAEAHVMAGNTPANRLAEDEEYWATIQRAFDLDRTMINLNNGGCSPAPTHVLEQMVRDLRFSNELPVEHMWGVLEPRIEAVRRELAREFGCDAEEMAITRNASEANQIMINGLDLQRGDEVILTTQNYPRMKNSWIQRERRHGIVIKWVKMDTPPRSEQAYVDAIAAAITPRTKAIEVMHLSFLTGYIAPVKQIMALARPRGIQVFVDGAHAFAHFPFTRDQLDADYYGTSLHKWLMAPIGTGFLYVRRNRVKPLWPMQAGSVEQEDNIRKFEEIGTHPAANHNSISVALAFHRSIGPERKIARLRFLRDRWAKRVVAESNGRARMLTPIGPNESGALAVIAIDGMKIDELRSWLLNRHKIVTVALLTDEFTGLRVTPNVYTTLDEVDRFAEVMVSAIKSGLTAN